MRVSTTARWPLGPREPRLAPGEVHVWRADLERATDDGGAELDSLSDNERARAERIVAERARTRWLRSRLVLRALLARYLRIAPADIALRVGPHGKPELAPSGVDDERAELWFNLSHSRDVALYVLCADGPVGVDVQHARPPGARAERDHVALAARTFGADDARRLEALDPSRREAEFLRLWTRYEAELKRRGTGIGAASSTPPSDAAEPSIVELDVGPDAAAALACTVAPRELRLWCWR
jgi:4'-phosphopantetheinyl transferase